MRIGIYCSEYPPGKHGGIGSVTGVIARSLAARGHQVWVGGYYAEPIPPELEHHTDQGVEVVRMPRAKGKFGWLQERYDFFHRVRRMMKAGELDVIEVPDWQGFAAGWPKLPGPVVTRLHGSVTYFEDEMGRRASRVSRTLEGASFRRADFRCSTSAYTAGRSESLFGKQRRPTTVLFNPVDVPKSAPELEREPNRVVFAGTLTEKKGVISLVKAWQDVRRAHPQAELHMFGKDAGYRPGQPMFPYLMSQVDPALHSSIVWHGVVPRERVMQEFRTARLAIFPSYSEAFSMVPLEAMAEKCPVVYTTRASGPELMTHGVDGMLVDPDNLGSISTAVLQLLRDDELARNIGAAGYQRVIANFSTETLLPRNEAFFEEAVHEFQKEGGRG